MKLTDALLGSMVLIAVVATPAFAALGGDSTSVQADVARMKGALRITSAAAVTVHEITTPYGTVIREYLTPGDQVFAVSWQGPVNPDLRQVLGSYYTQYEQAASAPHAGGHRHLTIQQPSLIVQVTGRLRAFQGRAWVPGLVPQNFSVTDIN
jgi:hypothetical protein